MKWDNTKLLSVDHYQNPVTLIKLGFVKNLHIKLHIYIISCRNYRRPCGDVTNVASTIEQIIRVPAATMENSSFLIVMCAKGR